MNTICACGRFVFFSNTKYFYMYKKSIYKHKFLLQAQNFVTETKQIFTQRHFFFFTSTKLCYRDMTVFHTRTHCFYKHKIFPRVHKFFSQAQNISTCTQILFMSTRYFYEYRRSGREFIPYSCFPCFKSPDGGW